MTIEFLPRHEITVRELKLREGFKEIRNCDWFLECQEIDKNIEGDACDDAFEMWGSGFAYPPELCSAT